MSYNNSNVPIIAITPDEGSNLDYEASNNIEEVATDVEDIYFQTEKRKKKPKKHAPKKDVYATDVEDLDGSDDDFSSPLIKHTNPISISQFLEFDIPTIDENLKTDVSKNKNKPKLRTQASVSSSSNYLQPSEAEIDDILTDLEDFDGSEEEDEVSDGNNSDSDLLKEIIYDSGTIAISDSVKKFLQAVSSPMVTPVADLSDDEYFTPKTLRKKSKNSKQYISPVLASSDFNDLTDTEILQCDSNETGKKHRYSKVRRHTLPKKVNLDVTDTEDLEVSENEKMKYRRVTVADTSKVSFDETDSRIEKSFIAIPQNLNEADSDYEEIEMFGKLKYEQTANEFLQPIDNIYYPTTDVEDMDGDLESENEEKNEAENQYDNSTYELETSDTIDEKCSMKSKNAYKIVERVVRKQDEKNWNSTENETDEEEGQCDSEIGRTEIQNSKIDTLDIKFVQRNKKEKVRKVNQQNKLLVPSTENENVLTDVENLNSSDDDDNDDGIDEIPVTVVNDLNSHLTDTESVEGEIENRIIDDVHNLPSCSRQLIVEKVNKNNYAEIVSTSLVTDEDLDTIDLSNETDIEEISGDDLQDTNPDKYYAIELDIIDNGNTESRDTLKLPTTYKIDEEETDVEDMDDIKPTPKKNQKKPYLTVNQDDTGKYTDVEDLDLSETENIEQSNNLQIVVDNSSAAKTDVEDFDASDNDQDRPVPEYSRTPDILRQMGRDTICSQEGSGHFSNLDRQKLDDKHNIVNVTAASPSPTNTDEFITSADDENFYSRVETATPLGIRQELDDASSRVHSQNIKKIDLDAEDEVMYLKGGGFFPAVYTDTEDIGISEEEYFLANDKNEDKILEERGEVSIYAELQNEGMFLTSLKSFVLFSNGNKTSIKSRATTYSLDSSKSKPELRNPAILFVYKTTDNITGQKTEINFNRVAQEYPYCVTMYYISYYKTIEFNHNPTFSSTFNFGEVNVNSDSASKSSRSQSLSYSQLTKSSFGIPKIPYFLRLRSGSVTKLITHYEHNPTIMKKNLHKEIALKEIEECKHKKEEAEKRYKELKHTRRSVVSEKAKHFEMLSKPFGAANITAKTVQNDREWSTSKTTPSDLKPSQEPAAAQDAAPQGITTSPAKQLVSSEVTGESIIHDVLSKDIKPVLDQTKMFIRMESQPETLNVCVNDADIPSQKVTSPELSDKASKDLDNKKEKSKSTRGFFSSLKSLVSRSVDSSDSESREEKTPKKKKKEKGTPKKNKKGAKKEKESSKSEGQSPKLEKKTKALYESQELDNIPSIDEIESNGIQVTDLDAEPSGTDDVKTKATDLVDNVINDSQKAATKLLEGKIQEFNLEGTVTPEEIRRSTEPIIINEDEFLVVIEPNNYNLQPDDYEDVQSPDVEEKEIKKSITEKTVEKSDDEEKSDTLKRKSVGFLKLFGKKDSKESDDESQSDEKREENRKSSGFFGLFSKKSKDDESIIEEKEIKKEELQTVRKENIIEFSKEVQQQMVDTAGFLLQEVELFHDVRPVYAKAVTETKQDMTSKNAERKESLILEVSEEVQQQIVDTARFLKSEVELFEDVRPQHVIKEAPLLKEDIKTKEESLPSTQGHIILSDEVQQQMVDTASFLLLEIENFEDVKRNYKNEEDIPKEVVKNLTPVLQQTDNIVSEVQVTQNEEVKSSDDGEKQSDDQAESKPGFFSKLGEKFGSKDKKEEPKEKKKKKREKKPGFFSKIGEKLSSLSDDEKEIKKSVKATKEEIKDTTEKKVFKIENKIKNIQETVNEVSDKPEILLDVSDKAASKFTDLEKSAKDSSSEIDQSVKQMKDNAAEDLQQIAADIKDMKNGTKETIDIFIDKSKDVASKSESKIEDVKVKAEIKMKDGADKTNDVAKQVIAKTDGFFSKFDKKVGDTVKEGTTKISETARSGQRQIEQTAIKSQEFVTDSAAKTETFLVEENVRDQTHDAKGTVEDAIEDTTDKTKEAVSDVKSTVDKVGMALYDTGDEIQKVTMDTKDSIVSSKDSATDKVKQISFDTTKEVTEKSGGFFSGLGKMIKGTSKDTKDEAVSKIKSGKVKAGEITTETKEVIVDTAETATDSVKKTISSAKQGAEDSYEKAEDKLEDTVRDLEQKIIATKDSSGQKMEDTSIAVTEAISDASNKVAAAAKDTKDDVINARDATAGTLKGTVSEAKDVTKDVTEKTGGFFSGLGKKIKGTTIDTKEELVSKAKSGKKKMDDIAADTKDTLKDSVDRTDAVLSDTGDKIKHKTHEAEKSAKHAAVVTKEFLTDAKSSAQDSVEKSGDKIKETLKDTKDSIDSAAKRVEEIGTDIKLKTSDAIEKTGEELGTAGDRIEKIAMDTKTSVEDTTSNVKESARDAAQKTGGFFSGLGKKFKGTTKEVKQEAVSKVKSAKDQIEDVTIDTKQVLENSADKTVEFSSDTEEKIKSEVLDAEESVKDVKEMIEKSATDAKDAVKKSTRETEDKMKESIKDVEEKVITVKDSADQKVSDTVTDVKSALKGASSKTTGILKSSGDKIQEVSKSTKENLGDAKDTITAKVKETSSNTKDVSKDAVEKTGGFFSGLGKKIKGTAKDTKEEAVSKAKSGEEKVKGVAADTQEIVKDSTVKTVTFFSDVENKIKDEVDESSKSLKESAIGAEESARDSFEKVEAKILDSVEDVVAAKDAASLKTKDTVFEMKAGTTDAVQKADTILNDTGDKIGEVSRDTKDSVLSAKDDVIEKVQKTTSDTKDATKDAVKTSEGFFSSLGKKIKGTTKDAKDEALSKAKSGQQKAKGIASGTKETLKDSADKTEATFMKVGDKIKDKSEDAKDSVTDIADSVKDSMTDFKDTVDGSVEKTADEIKVFVNYAKENIISAADDVGQKVKDTSSDIEKATKETEEAISGKINELAEDSKTNMISTKETASTVAQETASDIKESAKNVTDKTEGFFSGLEKKFKGAAKQSKDDVVLEAKLGKDRIKHVATDAKDVVKDSAEKTAGFLSDVGEKIKDEALDAKESAIKVKDAIKDSTSDAKDAVKDSAENARDELKGSVEKAEKHVTAVKDSAIHKIEDKVVDLKGATSDATQKVAGAVKDTVQSTKDSIEDTKDVAGDKVKETVSKAKSAADDVAEKTGGFFSGLGKKLKGTAKDTKEEVSSKAKSGEAKIKEVAVDTKEVIEEATDKTKELCSDIGDKIKDKTDGAQKAAKDVKESMKESMIDTKDIAKYTVDKMEDKVSEAVDGAKHDLVIIGDEASRKTKDTLFNIQVGASDAVHKAETTLTDTGDAIKDATKVTKDSMITAKDEIADKLKETSSKTKDSAENAAAKTEGFFSGLSKKIKGTAKDAEDKVVSKTKSGQEKVKDVAADTKEVLKETSNKTVTFFSDVEHEIKDKASDARDSAKDIQESIKDSAIDAKDAAQISAKKLDDKITETVEDTKLQITTAKDTTSEKIRDTAFDTTDAAKEAAEKTGGFFSGLGKKIKVKAKDTKEEVTSKTKSGQAKVAEVAVDTKAKLENSAAEATELCCEIGDKLKDEAAVAKDSVGAHKISIAKSMEDKKDVIATDTKDTVEKTGRFVSSIGTKLEDAAADTKEDIVTKTKSGQEKLDEVTADTKNLLDSSKDIATEKMEVATSKTKDAAKVAAEKSGEFFGDLGTKIKGTAEDTKEEIVSKTKSGGEKVKEMVADTKDVLEESADKTEKWFGSVGKKIEGKTKDIKDSASDIETSIRDSSTEVKSAVAGSAQKAGQKLEDSFEEKKKKITDTGHKVSHKVEEAAAGATQKTGAALRHASDKMAKLPEDVEINIIAAKDTFVEKIDETASHSVKATEQAAEILENEFLDKIKSATKDIKTEVEDKSDDSKKKTDFICYVTTPTMQRKGIGGSQRLSRDERPAPLDVSNMPIDISSDEEEYIVTEPTEKSDNYFDKAEVEQLSGSPLLIENILEDEHESTEEQFLGSSLEDSKRRPIFRIGSRDEESIDWGDRSEGKSIHSKVTITKSDNDLITPEAQSDIDLIENKLAELGKALDDLEKVDLDLEPQDDSEDKIEHKLRRVERRFERMASETMEKDVTEGKDSKLTSPEIEAKREDEFRKMVSQLSHEEVSECQGLYSNLWDDITFTPSEEWDSKTPDSQPDEIQDLPQGEVVYMGPVTLNKDNLVNKAGIQVDVIPIKRSPCTSPLPKRKLEIKGRAKSAMGFYKEKQIEERGSLPDLQSAGKVGDAKLDIQKGSIMSAILRVNPSILKEKSPSGSTSSLYFSLANSDNQLGRRMSTESLTRGSVVSAVKDWMARMTPFGSTDNVRSTDAASLADTISIFDDDNDSIELYSDSACLLESESSKSDNNIPDIYIYNENNTPALSTYDTFKFHDVKNSVQSQTKRVSYSQISLGETSGGPLTNLTTEGPTHPTNIDKLNEQTETPKPKPRIDKVPDLGKVLGDQKEGSSEVVAEDIAYSDRKKFWETVSSSKSEEEKPDIPIKKRMSLYEEQIYKQSTQEHVMAKKRTSIHEIGAVPPVPKPRSTLTQLSTEEVSISDDNQLKEVAETKKSETLVSEYRASFKDPNEHQTKDNGSSEMVKREKSDSIDSETEYLRYEHQTYENPGYLSDDQEPEQKKSEKQEVVAQVKRRQMSVSQPPVAAARKTIFERSVSLPTEDLQDVSDTSVRARKQFFEQQLKKEMVIDQLMTQLEEEELQEYKTLTSTEELSKVMTPEEKMKINTIISSVRESDKNIEKELKDIEKRISPMSSSSSQDTKTEDDITQYTPTSVKDLTKYFHSTLASEVSPKLFKESEVKTQRYPLEVDDNEEVSRQEITDEESVGTEKEILSKQKQPSTESEQSISSERSIELGSADEFQAQVAEMMQYRADSISKPEDSLEVHVDKSEIEDSEKGADMDHDGTDVEVKSFDADENLSDFTDIETKVKNKVDEVIQDQHKIPEVDEKVLQKISPIREHKEVISDTIWEVSVQSQFSNEIVESVSEIPIDKQVIVEKDEELSGSVRDESDLGSEIHQDHSESNSEKAKSDSHSEVEQLILESLYHQQINPEDARKIASELVDDIEAEIQRRNLALQAEGDESEPPAPHPDVAKNQISDYLRQLAESKGLDAKEVELVESVLARKQSEISRLGRRDTQTSSMDITDEDLRYSGTECDLSPSESQENILEEQIKQLQLQNNYIQIADKPRMDEEKFSEKVSDSKTHKIHVQQDREIHMNDSILSLKTETSGKVETATSDEKDFIKKSEQIADDQSTIDKRTEETTHSKTDKEQIELQTTIDVKGESYSRSELIDTKAVSEEKEEFKEKINVEKIETDKSKVETLTTEEANKKNVCMGGVQDALIKTHEKIEGGFSDTTTAENTKVTGEVNEETENKLEHKQEITVSDDGTETISEEIKENVHSRTVTTSEVVDHKREEKRSVTTFVQEFTDEPMNLVYEEFKHVQSDESKSSPYESAKSPEDLVSSSSSARKDDSDTSYAFDKPEVILRKTKFHKEIDTSSSSGKLKADRRSGADFEAYSSSGESHYHSFELDSARSRPCSSDVEGLIAAGSSEYESALTSQDVSSRSHITSTEYHTAVSSLSSRESMKSLDSESSGHLASIEVSEASETLVPSTFELEGDIIDGAVSQLLEDEPVDSSNGIVEPYDRNIPEHIIRGDYPMKDKKSSFDTISDSDIQGESMDISEEDSAQDKPITGEITSKMKRSHEMTFQPTPKAIIADSPQSETALEMDERFGSSLEDGSVLSMSLSSQSDATALRTVIELSRRDSDRLDGSMTISSQDSMSASNMSLDKIQPPISTATDSATSTGFHISESLSSVTLTTSTVDENGTQSVCTQVTSEAAASSDEVYNGPTQVDYVPEYDDVVETKKVRGHRRQESSTFVPSMIPGFTTRSKSTESEKQVTSTELTLKEEHNEEMKDVDETEDDTESDLRFFSQTLESDQEIVTISIEEKQDAELLDLMARDTDDIQFEPIERPITPEPAEDFDIRGSFSSSSKHGIEKQEILYEKQMKMSISEKSSIEEGEAEAAFSMVAHISPAHKIKVDICPIIEDEDAEKHELETRERAQKEMERRRAQIIRDQSPGSIPDIMVTEHMTPLVDREFHYPDLELEEKEAIAQRSAPQTPASISSKSSEDTDQGREYVLDDTHTSPAIPEEPELEESVEEKQITETKSEVSHATTVEEKTLFEADVQEPVSATESPNSDSFEMLEKPDIIDDFVVIEEVAKEAAEHDTEGKSVEIRPIKYIRKHDEEVEEYLVKSAPTPLTRMTDLKYYPDGTSSDELGPFDFEDSPPQAGKKSTGTKTSDDPTQGYACEYDKELEASKKWIEMQFQGDQAALINAGYGYEMEFERGPLEDIKEEEATDFESSRIGSLDSQKQSIGSLGSVKDSFSSTPEYDVLAGRKFFTRSGEHDDVSMSSLQEFEQLERVISLENRRQHQGSQDSSSNGSSFSKRYHTSRSGQGDDVSLSSLKEFEGLETACIEAHKIEVKAKEEEALLAQIDEAQENLISESESCKSLSSTDKKNLAESEEEDYEKRMFEIDEIIKQAQSNVEKFIDLKDMHDKTESMGRGDSLEEVSKVPDLELDEPVVLKSSVHTVQWETEDVMQTSIDSLNLDSKPHHESTDSLDMKTGVIDLMTASTDSIEFQNQVKSKTGMIQSDSIEMPDPDRSCMITSDSLELTPGALAQAAQMSDSIDEDGSRIGVTYDQSSSSGFSIKDEHVESSEIRDQRAEYLLGSTDSLDPSSSTATHATYQFETDSVFSGSFTSGGSNTMVSSTDTIDPLSGQAHGVDIAAAVRKVWFDDDSFGTGTHFTTELIDDGSKPYVTEVIEPCEGEPEYSHTIHRKVELPPEIKKITFKGPNADLQLRQYIENFGEGEDVQESQEVDKDGNIHVKRVVQKRFIVKDDPSGGDKRISGPELESYLQQVTSHPQDEFDLSYRDPSEFGLTKQTRTDSDGTKTIHGQKFTTKYVEGQEEGSSVKQLLSSIASDVTESSTYSEYKLTRHVDNQQEQATGSSTATFSGAATANVLKDERTSDDKPDSGELSQQQRDVADQHQLSTEMKELLEEMEKHSKQKQ